MSLGLLGLCRPLGGGEAEKKDFGSFNDLA